ncbi:RecQ family ATP-dependent DNA helicase [Aeromonas veronii]|uniref:DNA 3'-5' helicase n=1 Tax=Aeromonas veronii TaxID=654 RepID=A0AAN1UQC7_AERVE|nr:RecQ family ATP-dependent DNA helicase [Aeromonas veronii]AYV37641.1 RecQ family ATP-dependent DNA helicase [Aeromonas veronii]
MNSTDVVPLFGDDKILSFDLELTRDEKLRHLGALLAGRELNLKGPQDLALKELNALAQGADVILGHNILDFDLPWLAKQAVRPQLLLEKPVIDTLYLSPLAFPKNPYHRLVKDYKLVRDTLNDPVADARLALQIFSEQLIALQALPLSQLQLYQYLFDQGVMAQFNTQGLSLVFARLTGRPPVRVSELPTLIKSIAHDKACPNQLNRVIGDALRQPMLLLPLAYACAWLPVSGGNSVLPPWIWRRFPQTAEIIHTVRERHCGHADCSYCQENHDARRHLQRIFELDNFRNLPDGTPLQKTLIEEAMAGVALLGILPTSGGKSLCYQLPALVRNQRSGALTVVISPLQALMKDQVDNLKHKAGIEGVAAISGLLTLPERGAILEQIRMGDIALLYISPEQLRNRTVKQAIRQRQIGGWVFDEAHCLSKWGHDFRPDYLYCAKAIATIASEQQVPMPPVFCYTATAKPDVIEDICAQFLDKQPRPLLRLEGGVERTNLEYAVVECPGLNKQGHILNLLEQFFGEEKPGSCVIYCATKRSVDELADFLGQQQSLSVSRFYARMDSAQKKATLEQFINGEIRIICATNAFGMGIDKDDVRLVIHADIPGSLENYLQEAGRAGRDTAQAHCVLLFDEQDIEKQFQLEAMSEVSLRDIKQILRGIRLRASKGGKQDNNSPLVATSAELINQPEVETSFAADDTNADTKVKTAIAWLERAGYLERSDNITQVFQGRPLFASTEEAMKRVESLKLAPKAKAIWQAVIQALMSAADDDGLSADSIAEEAGQYMADKGSGVQASEVMRVLTQMADVGLLSQGMLLTTWLRPKGRDNSRVLCGQVHSIEKAMLDTLREKEPEPDTGQGLIFNIRLVNQAIKDLGHERCNPGLLRNLLTSWAQDGRSGGEKGSIDVKYLSRDLYQLTFNRTWSQIEQTIDQRHRVTGATLDFLYTLLASSEESVQRQVMLSFALEQLVKYLREDMDVAQLMNKREASSQQEWLLKGAERALLYLHEQHAIVLQNGLAVFRSAMTLTLTAERQQQYNKADYQPLEHHYRQKVIQIHVMNEYARISLEHFKKAKKLVTDYFSMEADKFLGHYFKGRNKILELATSEHSWKRIVEDLHNRAQEQIVQAPPEQNLLVLAGPGSGKSKVIIHRCAYLMRVKQVTPSKIMLLCYNHNAAMSLRRRLTELLGRDGARVSVFTFHGLAMSLTGNAVQNRTSDDIDFTTIIDDAIKLLRGEQNQLGLELEEQRERLLGGLQFLLVDEYQDIDEQQYQLIAALVGKSEEDEEARLHLMAVGDDDQSIYAFRDANVSFIRRFEQDYNAQTHFLTWNYRSTAHIIETSNRLIEHNQDRMKRTHPIEIDDRRKMEVAGGHWEGMETAQGRVIIQQCQDAAQQAAEVVRHIALIREKTPTCPLESIAVLARNGLEKEELAWVRSALADADIPCRFTLDKENGFPVHRCREILRYQNWLQQQGHALLTAEQLAAPLPPLSLANRWEELLHDLIAQWQASQGEHALSAHHFLMFLYEYLSEQKRQIRFGKGVLLSTVHGVKGEEYRHVILLDGGWQRVAELSNCNLEEERRLFYVGMTRAIERLVLMARHDQRNPHIPLIASHCYVQRPNATRPDRQRRFAMMGMSQLVLGYAGHSDEGQTIHNELRALKVGDAVRIAPDKQDRLHVYHRSHKIARLSLQGEETWKFDVNTIREARVVALVERRKEQEKDEYQPKMRSERWEIPIIELEL